MAKQQKIKWIIGMSGSEWDAVDVYSFEGTKHEAKKVLARLVKEDAKEDDFDYGDTKISDVKENGDVLYAGSTFNDHHNDYTATPLSEVPDIESFFI